MGVRKDWRKKSNITDRIIHTKIEEAEMKLNIFLIYNSGKWKDMEEMFEKIDGRYEDEGISIDDDFNMRIGELGGMEDK